MSGPIERTYLHLVASHEPRNESHRQPVNADFQIQKALGVDISPNLLQILTPLNWIIKSSSFKSCPLPSPTPWNWIHCVSMLKKVHRHHVRSNISGTRIPPHIGRSHPHTIDGMGWRYTPKTNSSPLKKWWLGDYIAFGAFASFSGATLLVSGLGSWYLILPRSCHSNSNTLDSDLMSITGWHHGTSPVR